MTNPTPLEITFDLSLLHPAQLAIFQHPARFRVAACGRRFGKTVGASLECVITALHTGKLVWFVSPTYSMSQTAWGIMREAARQIPGAQIYKSDQMLQLPGGGEVWCKSGQEPDKLRGTGLLLVVIEEAAYCDPDVWTVIRPALSDTLGRALFISSANGRNWFWELHRLEGLGVPDWKSFLFPTSANPNILPSEIEAARQTMPAMIFEREYLCSFDDMSGSVFRNIEDTCYAGLESPQPDKIYSMGVDMALRRDYTALVVVEHESRRVVDIDRFHGVNWNAQRDRIRAMAQRWHCRTVKVEANSIGGPNIEELQRSGLPVQAFTTTNESKQAIVESLALAFEQQRIGLPKDHPLTPVLIGELQAFAAEQLPSGRWRYAASGTGHDDLVIALALVNDNVARTPLWEAFVWSVND